MSDLRNGTVAVVGAGTMGASIAQHFASFGLKTYLYNRTTSNLEKARARIAGNVEVMISLGALKNCEDVDQAMSRLICTSDLEEAVSHADIIFECVSEDVQLKREIFHAIDRLAPADAYICSDTSAMDIYKEIPDCRPDRILITHFFNPPHVMPLVEIVKGENTPSETIEEVKAFLTETGKKTIVINRCIPGFIFNRLLTALEREALYIVEQGVATAEDVDMVITTTFGPRFTFEGIFDLLDHVGLDVEAAVVGDLLPELCQDVTASPVLVDKAEKGEYGVKTGKGFKDYTGMDIEEIRKERTARIVKILKHIEDL